MPRKMSDDERRRRKEQDAEWAREQAEFAATFERLKARWREEDERRERRRRRRRRLLLLER